MRVVSEALLQKHALAKFGAWNTKSPLSTEPQVTQLLNQGSGHTTLLVTADSDTGHDLFVLRYRTHQSTSLGLSFKQEVACMELARAQGLAPEVVWLDEESQSMVIEFLHEPGSVSPEELVNLTKSIHRLPPEMPPINLQHQIEHYWQTAHERGNSPSKLVSPNDPALGAAIKALESELPVTCHNDLTPPNIRRRNRDLVAIDWEYAATGSPHFEVATLCAGWPSMNAQSLATAILGDRLSKPLLDIATDLYAALNWNWHLAAGETFEGEQSPKNLIQRLAAHV